MVLQNRRLRTVSRPLPAKNKGIFLEKIARNHWSVGVRDLPQKTYDRIVRLAGLIPDEGNAIIGIPDLSEITIRESNTPLLVPRSPGAATGMSESSGGRYSRRDNLTG